LFSSEVVASCGGLPTSDRKSSNLCQSGWSKGWTCFRKYATAAISTLNIVAGDDALRLDRHRDDAQRHFLNRSTTAMMNLRPGSVTSLTRPSRNNTPLSYWVTTRINRDTTISATMNHGNDDGDDVHVFPQRWNLRSIR
jgi:hypothetical protein